MPAALNQIMDVWGRLGGSQRVGVAAAALATVGLTVALVYYAAQPEYTVLFSDLRPEDAQRIVEKLKGGSVPYTLAAGGTTVSVPAGRVAELRLEMAAAGVIAGGHVGFDLFDKTSFGTTDFAQQVNYRRAIEGELGRTLEGVEEIESARVHVTLPRESLYADKTERAKASVMVKVRQGRELSRERTEAVTSLVASAVEGLDPADVSVVDARGRLLSAAGREGVGGVGAFNSHLEARRKFEAETAARVISLLEPVSGAGRVRADVAAELDFSSVETTEEHYDPQRQVIRSQQTTQEARGAAAAGAAGLVGARANDPAAQTPPAAAYVAPNAGGDQRSATTTNYEIDKTVRHTLGGGGRIQRLSVSVVVDYKQAEGQQVARSEQDLRKMQELVSAAVGLDPQRGDQIVVQTIPFDQPAADVRARRWDEQYRDLINTSIKYGAIVLVALLLLVFVVRPARKALRLAAARGQAALPAATEQAHSATLPGAVAGVAGALKDGAAASAAELAEGRQPRTVAQMQADIEAEMQDELAREMFSSLPEVKRASAIKKHLVDRSEHDAELIAMTLRGWIQENR